MLTSNGYLYLLTTARCHLPCMDGVFVLDISQSIGSDVNFNLMKDFVKRAIRLVDISAECSHAAVILFAANPTIRFDLDDYIDEQSLVEAVDAIVWSNFDHTTRNGTNTPAALDLMLEAGQNGTLGLRDNTLHIGVVITDGNPFLKHISQDLSNDIALQNTVDAGDRLHKSRLYHQVYAIGIEGQQPIGEATLRAIADAESRILNVDGFDDNRLMEIGREVAKEFCRRE